MPHVQIQHELTSAILGVAIATVAQAQCALNLTADDGRPCGSSPNSIAVGDLNDDGHVDCITGSYSDADGLSVFLNTGTGTFHPGMSVPSGPGIWSVAIGHLNSDAVPDVVTANYNNDTVSVLLGIGGGAFGPAMHIPVPDAGPETVKISDMNLDGRQDIVVLGYDASSLSIFLGGGDGTFGLATTRSAQGAQYWMDVADFNNDGKPDIVAVDDSLDVARVFLGLGDGTVQDSTPLAVGDHPFGVAAGDLNLDGRADIVTANGESSNVSVLLGNGQGEFGTAVHFAAGGYANSVALGDINGDGRLDAITGNDPPGTVSVLRGLGNGAFMAPLLVNVSGAYAVAPADLDGDTRLDIVATSVVLNKCFRVMNTSLSFPAPFITQQPVGLVATPASTASFSVAAVTAPGVTISYRWRRNGEALQDGDGVAGAHSPTLMINAISAANEGAYDVIVGAPACGGGHVARASSTAVLAVTEPDCTADFNGQDGLDSQDFFDFLNAFFDGCD